MAQQRTRTRSVTFLHSILMPSVGVELPAGAYQVTDTDSYLGARLGWANMSTQIHIGPGILKAGDLGGSARLLKGELDAAVFADRDKT